MNNIKLKFLFWTNFQINYNKQKKTRYHYCKIFFLLIFFLVFCLNKKLKKNLIKKKFINFFFSKKLINLQNLNNFFIKIPLQKKIKRNNFFFLKKFFFYYYFNTQNDFFFLKKKKSKNLKKIYKIHFIIFTKIFSHFVLLRAPFRDKISKNILQHQRFFISLNISIKQKTSFIILKKFFLYQYLNNFQIKNIFNSNIIYLHSQKITFFFTHFFL